MSRFLPLLIALALGIAAASIPVLVYFIVTVPEPKTYTVPVVDSKRLTYADVYRRK
jgi:hypothetical protein